MAIDPFDPDFDHDSDSEADDGSFGADIDGWGADPPTSTPLTRWAPPCPYGHPQRPVIGFAHRDKGGGLVEVRVPVRRNESICAVVVQESLELVLVRVLVCCPGGHWDDCAKPLNRGAKACLEDDLDERWVIDVESGHRLPPWEPGWS